MVAASAAFKCDSPNKTARTHVREAMRYSVFISTMMQELSGGMWWLGHGKTVSKPRVFRGRELLEDGWGVLS